MLSSRWSGSFHCLDSGKRTYKFSPQVFGSADWQPHWGSGVIVLGRIVIILATFIWVNTFVSFCGVGSHDLPSAHRMAIAIVIIIII